MKAAFEEVHVYNTHIIYYKNYRDSLDFPKKSWNGVFSDRKPNRLLPGPPSLPVVGSLPFLGSDIMEQLRKMAQK